MLLPVTTGDDAVGVQWTDIDSCLNLYASHTSFIKEVADRLTAHWWASRSVTARESGSCALSRMQCHCKRFWIACTELDTESLHTFLDHAQWAGCSATAPASGSHVLSWIQCHCICFWIMSCELDEVSLRLYLDHIHWVGCNITAVVSLHCASGSCVLSWMQCHCPCIWITSTESAAMSLHTCLDHLRWAGCSVAAHASGSLAVSQTQYHCTCIWIRYTEPDAVSLNAHLDHIYLDHVHWAGRNVTACVTGLHVVSRPHV